MPWEPPTPGLVLPSLDMIFFDAGGTLLYPEAGVGAAYAAAARRHGLLSDADRLEAAFRTALAAKRRESLVQDREWWRDVVRITFRTAGEPRDPDRLFAEVYDHFARAAAWRLYPGAREVPAALRARGYRTGLISNWDDRLRGLLAELELTPGLEPVVVSNEIGAEKPDPRIFRAALDLSGVAPERALMVGDDAEADVAGARAAGMHAIRFDPEGNGSGPDRLTALGDLLDRLPGSPGRISPSR